MSDTPTPDPVLALLSELLAEIRGLRADLVPRPSPTNQIPTGWVQPFPLASSWQCPACWKWTTYGFSHVCNPTFTPQSGVAYTP
jgi:hypothetical protein